jgi:hypothetical protein
MLTLTIVAVLLGALILGEALTMVIAIGGGITILVCIW